MTTAADPGGFPGAPGDATDHPPSRRALRERAGRPSVPVVDPRDDDDLSPDEPGHVTWWHLLTLAAVACGLGLLIWTLNLPAEAGAAGAAPTDPITSLSAPAAAHRGEL